MFKSNKADPSNMTVRPNTFNTNMLDVQSISTQEYLKDAFGEDDKELLATKKMESRITAQ